MPALLGRKPVLLAVATAACALGAALPVEAALVLSSPTSSFTGSATVTDAEGGGATTQDGANAGSVSLQQFNSAQGVLTGVTLHLNSSLTHSTQVKSTAGGGTGANSNVSSSGTGSSTAQVSAPGLAQSFGTLTASDACAEKWKNSCADAATTKTGTANASIGTSTLDSYVGANTVDIALKATQSAQQQSSVFSGSETTTSTLNWAGSMYLAYEYLLHAAASFSASGSQATLDLDFGNVALGSAATLNFDLFNLADANRVGLDFDGFSASGDTDRFSTNLALFAALSAGSGHGFLAELDTSTAGLWEASWLLQLSDADVGAESSRGSHFLTLNLRGNVVAPVERLPNRPNAVPEPGTIALLSLALVSLAALRRRRG